jgi:hypothetical protein
MAIDKLKVIKRITALSRILLCVAIAAFELNPLSCAKNTETDAFSFGWRNGFFLASVWLKILAKGFSLAPQGRYQHQYYCGPFFMGLERILPSSPPLYRCDFLLVNV